MTVREGFARISSFTKDKGSVQSKSPDSETSQWPAASGDLLLVGVSGGTSEWSG